MFGTWRWLTALDAALDATGDPNQIAAGTLYVTADGLATNGAEYLLTAWSEQPTAHLYPFRLQLDGSLNSTQEIPLIWAGPRPACAVVAWGGAHWAVAYIEDADGEGVNGYRVFVQLLGCP